MFLDSRRETKDFALNGNKPCMHRRRKNRKHKIHVQQQSECAQLLVKLRSSERSNLPAISATAHSVLVPQEASR
jgi:hypothetical protein